MHLSNENKGHNSLIYSEELKTSVYVETTTLDDFLTIKRVPEVDIIKMDIEGAEILALEGMKNTLIKHMPLLFLEFSPHSIIKTNRNPLNLLCKLQEIGYSIFNINKVCQRLDPVNDLQRFIDNITEGKYADIYCEKTNAD